MLVYIVMYHDESWGTSGDKIVGVFDTLKQAKKLIKRIENRKGFKERKSAYAYIVEFPFNYAAEDYEIFLS